MENTIILRSYLTDVNAILDVTEKQDDDTTAAKISQ